MLPIESKNIDEIFTALDRQIGLHGGKPIGLVVCGGTALAALDLVHRTTKDVDVLGEVVKVKKDVKIIEMTTFPQWLI